MRCARAFHVTSAAQATAEAVLRAVATVAIVAGLTGCSAQVPEDGAPSKSVPAIGPGDPSDPALGIGHVELERKGKAYRARLVWTDSNEAIANQPVYWYVDRWTSLDEPSPFRVSGDAVTTDEGILEMNGVPDEGFLVIGIKALDREFEPLYYAALPVPTAERANQVEGRIRSWRIDRKQLSAILKVVDSGGEPILGAQVVLTPTSIAGPKPGVVPAKVDEGGVIEFHGLPSSVYWAVVIAEGYAPVKAPLAHFAKGETPAVSVAELRRGVTVQLCLSGLSVFQEQAGQLTIGYYYGLDQHCDWWTECNDGEVSVILPAGGGFVVNVYDQQGLLHSTGSRLRASSEEGSRIVFGDDMMKRQE